MSLSCDCDFEYEGEGWYWCGHGIMIPKTFSKRKRCCSCKKLINFTEDSMSFYRYRAPLSEIEERIFQDEVSLADWHMCEICSGLVLAVEELGFCYDIHESMKDQIAEYRELEKENLQIIYD